MYFLTTQFSRNVGISHLAVKVTETIHLRGSPLIKHCAFNVLCQNVGRESVPYSNHYLSSCRKVSWGYRYFNNKSPKSDRLSNHFSIPLL